MHRKFDYCCFVVCVEMFNNVTSALVTRNTEPLAESDVIKIKKNKLTLMSFGKVTATCVDEALQGSFKWGKC